MLMKSYYRVMLGKGSKHAVDCFAEHFIGADFGIHQDLSGKLPDVWRAFNKEFFPILMKLYPGMTRIGAGLRCGFLWTVSKGIQKNDVVLCPDGAGGYRVGEVIGDYFYQLNEILPHRRPVQWMEGSIDRVNMSDELKNSAGSIGTVSNITKYGDEIEKLINGFSQPKIISTDPEIEDPLTFAMEKHLEDFLIANWNQTDLGKEYDIFEDEGEKVGQQYPTDTGAIDILAISKDKKRLLVLELKRGRASDVVVGQTLRYMGYVQDELAEEGQTVQGTIVALEDDQKIRRALAMVPAIDFYRYQVIFKLIKG
jgi:restriction system protein